MENVSVKIWLRGQARCKHRRGGGATCDRRDHDVVESYWPQCVAVGPCSKEACRVMGSAGSGFLPGYGNVVNVHTQESHDSFAVEQESTTHNDGFAWRHMVLPSERMDKFIALPDVETLETIWCVIKGSRTPLKKARAPFILFPLKTSTAGVWFGCWMFSKLFSTHKMLVAWRSANT